MSTQQLALAAGVAAAGLCALKLCSAEEPAPTPAPAEAPPGEPPMPPQTRTTEAASGLFPTTAQPCSIAPPQHAAVDR